MFTVTVWLPGKLNERCVWETYTWTMAFEHAKRALTANHLNNVAIQFDGKCIWRA